MLKKVSALADVTWAALVAVLFLTVLVIGDTSPPLHRLKAIRLLGSDSQSFEVGSHAPQKLKLFVNLGRDHELLKTVERLQEEYHRHGLRVIGIARPEDAVEVQRALARGSGRVDKADGAGAAENGEDEEGEYVRVVQRGKEESWKLEQWLASFHSAAFEGDFESFLVDPTDNFISRFAAKDLKAAFETETDDPTMAQELEHLAKFHGSFQHGARDL